MEGGKHEKDEESFRKQLASAVRSIQWSYAIFWSPSSTQIGGLEWREGYYNGDIKTRKTMLGMDQVDEIGCERSDQLRELYEFLLQSENNPQPRRPTAALSPEDLTNTEWYYLICMSFVFSNAQGLPGRSLANGQPIWLSNVHCASTCAFGRALLAKSAGIKTVVCFPCMSGVIELGVTESVQEDLDLIQHVKTSFFEVSFFDKFNIGTMQTDLPQLIMQGEDLRLGSPSASLNGLSLIETTKNQPLFEYIKSDAFEALSWNLIDEEFSNGIHNSMTSSDGSMSQTFANLESCPTSPINEAITNDLHMNQLKMIQNFELCEDLHYQNILSSLFKKSHPLVSGISFRPLDKRSCFICWKREGEEIVLERGKTSQKMLKAILVDVPRMHNCHLLELKEDNTKKVLKGSIEEANANHVLAERRRRERVNGRFCVLKSMIPPTNKGDKISILDETISYLKELERRVEELESCQELAEYERKNKRKPQDMEERTCDNYGDNVNDSSKNRRKGRDHDEGTHECIQSLTTKDNLVDNMVTVCMVDKDIVIEIKCPWRVNLLLEIIDVVSTLHLDSHSIQSSTTDGILSLTIKSKLGEFSNLSVAMITQTLQRVIGNC